VVVVSLEELTSRFALSALPFDLVGSGGFVEEQKMQIRVESKPERAALVAQGVFSWPIWECGVSDFPWHYDEEETCYLLEGEVTVTPDGAEPVHFAAGDLVVFPAGMSCRWQVHVPVRKHYRFS
jgi:uncharacterized cupin superfamily protein